MTHTLQWSRVLALVVPLIAAPAWARGSETATDEAPSPLALHAYTLEHQSAREAVGLVTPLLSPRGSVELQPATNTLVVRDSLAALSRVAAVLRSFDHPAQPIEVVIELVEAHSGSPSGAPVVDPLPVELEQRLKQLLRYDRFQLLARTELESREGENVSYQVGDGYEVNFQLGTVVVERLKLHGFRLVRAPGSPVQHELIHTNLNLVLEKPTILGLARREDSPSALMVVLTVRTKSTPGAARE